MFRGLLDLINVLMAWGFAYVISFMVLIVAITYITKQNPTPIIQERITIKVIEPKPITIEEDVCNRIDGCPVVEGVCIGCQTISHLH
jgi:hypothetical protein